MKNLNVNQSSRPMMSLRNKTSFTLAAVLAGSAAVSMGQVAPSTAGSANVFGPPAPVLTAKPVAPIAAPTLAMAPTPVTPAAPATAVSPAPVSTTAVGANPVAAPPVNSAPIAQAAAPTLNQAASDNATVAPAVSAQGVDGTQVVAEPAPNTVTIIAPNVPALIGLGFFHLRNVTHRVISMRPSIRIVVRR